MIDGRVLAIFSALRSSNSNWNDDEWGNCSLHCHNQRVRKKTAVFLFSSDQSPADDSFISHQQQHILPLEQLNEKMMHYILAPSLPCLSVRPSVKNTVHRTVHQGHLRTESNRIDCCCCYCCCSVCVMCRCWWLFRWWQFPIYFLPQGEKREK